MKILRKKKSGSLHRISCVYYPISFTLEAIFDLFKCLSLCFWYNPKSKQDRQNSHCRIKHESRAASNDQ